MGLGQERERDLRAALVVLGLGLGLGLGLNIGLGQEREGEGGERGTCAPLLLCALPMPRTRSPEISSDVPSPRGE